MIPYFFPWMRMPPIRTGISLQHLKMTWRTRVVSCLTCEINYWKWSYHESSTWWINDRRTPHLGWVVEIAQTSIRKSHCGHGGDGQKCVGPQRNFPRLLSHPHFYLGLSEWIARTELSLLLSLLFQRLNNNQTVWGLSTSRTLWILAARISAPGNCH